MRKNKFKKKDIGSAQGLYGHGLFRTFSKMSARGKKVKVHLASAQIRLNSLKK